MNNLKCTCPKCKFQYVIPLNRDLVRTLPMNKLYWGVYIKIISEELGYFPEDLHEELKLKLNPKDSVLNLGERFGGSTSKMKRKEFSDYLTKIRIWAKDFCDIDLPEREDKSDKTK